MRFDTPATTNPIDQLKVVGKPTDRIDGPRKTTGTATYAYEWHDVVPDPAYGYVVGCAIATPERAGNLGMGDGSCAALPGGPAVQHYQQAVAVVVAEPFERAGAAAQLAGVAYVPAPGAFALGAGKASPKPPPKFDDPAE